jgi:hypothetical protein
MVMISQSDIDAVLARTDIVSLISESVAIKKAGKSWVGLCPFHDEKSPSFTIDDKEQFFYCFGCGASGNAVGFDMRINGRTFPDSVGVLARRAGMTIGGAPATYQQTALELAAKRRREYEVARVRVAELRARIAMGEDGLRRELMDLNVKFTVEMKAAIKAEKLQTLKEYLTNERMEVVAFEKGFSFDEVRYTLANARVISITAAIEKLGAL